MGFLNDFLGALGVKKNPQKTQEKKADIKKDFTAPTPIDKDKVQPESVVKENLEQPLQKKPMPGQQDKEDLKSGQPATSIEELEKRMQSDGKIKFQEGGPEEKEQKKE